MKIRLSRRGMLASLAGLPLATRAGAQTCTGHYTYPRWNINAMHQQLLHPDGSFVMIAAHRGLWRDTPENSESGLRNAMARWELVETDLRRTSDWATAQDLAITHDAEISRTTNGAGWIDQLSMADLAQCRLLDRYGAVYQGGNCYPADSQGTSLNDAITGVGRKVLKLADLLQIHQDFLSGTDAVPYGPILILDVKVDPNSSLPGLGIYETMNIALNHMQNLSIGQRKAFIFMVKFNTILDPVNLETYVPRYTAFHPETNPLPRIMLIFSPEDARQGTTPIPPASNSAFLNWTTKPYLSHVEMNQFYLGDGCQAYIDYLRQNNLGISTYSENPFFPEGVWDNTVFRFRNSDYSVPDLDLRQIPDQTMANNGVGLVTSERPAETDAFLKQYNLRNIPVQ